MPTPKQINLPLHSTPCKQCATPRQPFVKALLDAGFPVFTAPAFLLAGRRGVGLNATSSTAGETGCPDQPPVDCHWDATGWVVAAGHAGANFLGWLAATYNYTVFDLVGSSYGGVVGRATISALKAAKKGNTGNGFSYAAYAAAANVSILSLTTMNSPHLGSPAYDIAADNATAFAPVAAAWGVQYAQIAQSLVSDVGGNAGAVQFLVTRDHTAAAAQAGLNWDATQVGALDGVAVTLIGGDYCGPDGCGKNASTAPRSDGTVALYSSLMQECPSPCGPPPASVYVPAGLVPADAVRKVFKTVHSRSDIEALAKLTGKELPATMNKDVNPDVIRFVVDTVRGEWKKAGLKSPR